jgi:hypothetical protein
MTCTPSIYEHGTPPAGIAPTPAPVLAPVLDPNPERATWDVAVVGGGAAGLMAALFAARGGARTVLLEGSRQCGTKILISGGGRCNVLPVAADLSDFHTAGSAHVLRRWFRTWPLAQVREFFRADLGIELVEESSTGKLFPATQDAHTVRDSLLRAVDAAGARVCVAHRVLKIDADRARATYALCLQHQPPAHARRVIVATGGLSLPRTGSDGAGYAFAAQFGHGLVPTYPALVPLTTGDPDFQALAGISLLVEWSATIQERVLERRVRELLFTHRGFSGPAILDASHYYTRDRASIRVAWGAVPAVEWEERLLAAGRRSVEAVLAERLPRRLAQLACERAGLRAPVPAPASHLARAERSRLLSFLSCFPLPISGDLAYRAAEVTGGGIPIDEVDPSTLESRRSPGLYLSGEMLDVTGRLGGFNFLWAWISGRMAGESAAAAAAAARC